MKRPKIPRKNFGAIFLACSSFARKPGGTPSIGRLNKQRYSFSRRILLNLVHYVAERIRSGCETPDVLLSEGLQQLYVTRLRDQADPFRWWNAVIGLVLTALMVIITEYYTATEYRPVRSIAQSSTTGHGTNVIQGLAISLESTALPTLVIVVAVVATYQLAGIIGVAFADDDAPPPPQPLDRAIKHISLGSDSYVALGGEWRERWEYYSAPGIGLAGRLRYHRRHAATAIPATASRENPATYSGNASGAPGSSHRCVQCPNHAWLELGTTYASRSTPRGLLRQ